MVVRAEDIQEHWRLLCQRRIENEVVEIRGMTMSECEVDELI